MSRPYLIPSYSLMNAGNVFDKLAMINVRPPLSRFMQSFDKVSSSSFYYIRPRHFLKDSESNSNQCGVRNLAHETRIERFIFL